MKKAFIFDMDGVIVASEVLWHKLLDEIWPDLVGKDVAKKYPVPVGMTPVGIFEGAVRQGSSVTKEVFLNKFDEIAQRVYSESLITDNTDELGKYLVAHEYHLGLVSSSRVPWINVVLKRLSFSHNFEYILSINDRLDLKPKPSPVGIIETIQHLGSIPTTTIVLEDSNSGIEAAKKAGAFAIALSANLLPDYIQHGADAYAKTMKNVIYIIDELDKRLALHHNSFS